MTCVDLWEVGSKEDVAEAGFSKEDLLQVRNIVETVERTLVELGGG